MSKREQPTAIISMAQHARPKVIGHMLDSRAQLMACSSEVVMTLSSNRPSSQPIANHSVEGERFVQGLSVAPVPASGLLSAMAGPLVAPTLTLAGALYRSLTL